MEPRTPGSTASTGSVSLRSLSKDFAGQRAVSDIDLEIEAGEFISLLGPSGCGKTTLLRMIGGFEHPSSGEILLDGRPITDMPAHRRPINTVFQSYALFPHMTVSGNVAYGLRQSGVPRREIGPRVAEALEMVRMIDFTERRPAMMSGGQQQRVALARALVNRPAVLLLDEPMSALDRKLREEMQIELKLLQRQLGTTFVFVTHDQEEALTMSDRIVVMSAGAIQQIGDAETVYAHPANAFVAGFIGRQNFLPGRVSAAEADLLTVDTEIGAVRIAAPPEPVAIGDRVRAAVRPESVTIAAAGGTGDDRNRLRGRIGAVFFLGDAVSYALILDDGTELLSREPRGRAAQLSTGDEAEASFSAADVQVFAP